MKKTKLFALLLALVMIITAFAGCADTKTSDEPTTDAEIVSETSEEKATIC